jgi:hypothetical protein
MTDLGNVYISLVAAEPEEATRLFREVMGQEPIKLVHTEPATEEGEQPTFLFLTHDETGDVEQAARDGELDMLCDLYTGLDLPNYPVEVLA